MMKLDIITSFEDKNNKPSNWVQSSSIYVEYGISIAIATPVDIQLGYIDSLDMIRTSCTYPTDLKTCNFRHFASK